MKRPYEMMIVYDGTLPDETVQQEQKRVEDFLKEHAEYQSTEVWGKRQLAYTINKKKSGVYCLFNFIGENTIVAGIDKLLKLNENVLRYMAFQKDLKNEAARAAFAVRKEKAGPEMDGPDIDLSEGRHRGGRGGWRDRRGGGRNRSDSYDE